MNQGPVRIEPGDTLDIRFPFKIEWNHSVRVTTDGRASFMLLGDVEVAGLSVADLNAKLVALYQKEKEAVTAVTVNLVPGAAAVLGGGSAGSPSVFVFGEVKTPGAQALEGRQLTLLESLGRAGGHLKATANLSHVLLVRRLADGQRTVAWLIDAEPVFWPIAPPVFLQANDVVFIPNTVIDDIDIFVDQYIRQLIPFPYLVPTSI
jgi:polysaccharide export outer membrane protein